jgi:oligopeptide/dipeptide ABC transporter ATP-binding protein
VSDEPLIEARGLRKTWELEGGMARPGAVRLVAVDGVDLTIGRGETVHLVGESGCGKTTLGRLLLRLVEPTAGRVLLRIDPDTPAVDLFGAGARRLRGLRRHVQIVFQDPFGSLNPRLTVGATLIEALRAGGAVTGVERRLTELLEDVGLSGDARFRYAHEFSGGQRQRIAIARALAPGPRLIVCDEPVSALDVSIRAQIVNLLRDLQERLGLAYLFITHDLSLVRHFGGRVYVMYLGRVVEQGPVQTVFARPAHPYTRALLSAIPSLDPGRRAQREILSGEVPSAIDPPAGCPFHPRCPLAEERCLHDLPPSVSLPGGQAATCHFPHLPDAGGEA